MAKKLYALKNFSATKPDGSVAKFVFGDAVIGLSPGTEKSIEMAGLAGEKADAEKPVAPKATQEKDSRSKSTKK